MIKLWPQFAKQKPLKVFDLKIAPMFLIKKHPFGVLSGIFKFKSIAFQGLAVFQVVRFFELRSQFLRELLLEIQDCRFCRNKLY